MKKYFLLIFTVLSLISPVSQAQAANECIVTFTHEYFNWLKTSLPPSNADTFKEAMAMEKAKFKELLTLIKELNDEQCTKYNKTQIATIYQETLKMYEAYNRQYLGAKRGTIKVRDEKNRLLRSKYLRHAAGMVQSLRRQTGIQW